jgi:PAS domain S-box-containing protein
MLNFVTPNEVKFVDIDDGNTLARAIVDSVRDPLLVLDQHQNIVAASRSFYQTFQLNSRDVRGHLLYEIEHGQWDLPELRRLLEKIAMDDTAVEGYEVAREFPGIGHRVMLLNARKVFYEDGTHTKTLLAFEDVTDRRAIEVQVQELLHINRDQRTAANSSPIRAISTL